MGDRQRAFHQARILSIEEQCNDEREKGVMCMRRMMLAAVVLSAACLSSGLGWAAETTDSHERAAPTAPQTAGQTPIAKPTRQPSTTMAKKKKASQTTNHRATTTSKPTRRPAQRPRSSTP